jgi:solute carrier family 24 (sodium/potassium/calcium exchanger), member 6
VRIRYGKDYAQCVWITVHQGDEGCDSGDGHFVGLFSLGSLQPKAQEACTAIDGSMQTGDACKRRHHVDGVPDETECTGVGSPQDVNRQPACQFIDGIDGQSYTNMYYCTYGHHRSVGTFVQVAILVLMFLLLGSTSEEFFCPALASLSEMLGLKPRVAGVTLLALGNGAPDVFSIFASVKAKQAGMAVGEVTGAGNFVATAVVGAVALTTDDGLKARGMFIRDLCMLIVATGLLLHVFIDGEVDMVEAVAFLVLYAGYVSVVIIGDRVPPMLKKERPAWREERARKQAENRGEEYAPSASGVDDRAAPLMLESENDGVAQSGPQSPRGQRDDHDFFLPKLGAINMGDSRFSHNSVTPKSSLTSPARPGGAAVLQPPAVSGLTPLRERWGTKSMSGRDVLSPDMNGAGFSPRPRSASRAASFKQKKGWTKYRMKSKLDLAIEWSEMSTLDKAIYVFESPFTLARSLTIPVVVEDDDDEDWDAGFARMFMILNPPFALPFLANGFAGMFAEPLAWNSLYMSISIGVGLLCCPLVWLNTARKPPKILIDIYVVVAFLNALFWIGFVADDLVALLNTLGGVWELDHAAMGLTVLAMGNSLGDMAADLAVARSGKPNMAVTACYAGPFFNMCIGIGVSFLLVASNGGTVSKNAGPGVNYNRPDMNLSTILFFSSSWLMCAPPHTQLSHPRVSRRTDGTVRVCVVLASINSMVVSMTMGAACLFKFQLPVQFGYALMVSYAVFCLLAVTVVQRSPKFYECTTWGVFDGHIDKPACH